MLRITRSESQIIAKCGRGEYVLPIVERLDPESGETMTELLTPSGVRALFRTAVDVRYVPVKLRDTDGSVKTSYAPTHRIIGDVSELLTKLAYDNFAGQFVRISRMKDAEEASRELSRLMSKTVNRLCREQWDWESSTPYEAYANSQQAVVLDGKLHSIKGKFVAELDAHRRLEGAKALMKAGLLRSPCATGTGSPGKSYYLSTVNGHSITEAANPLIHEAPEKRLGVINAVKNAVETIGEEESPVRIQSATRTPPITNAVVVCMPIAGDDSVIISRFLAERLTAKIRRSNYHNIDGVINFRGGLRPTGRNGRFVKKAAEWPLINDRTETVDREIVCSRRIKETPGPLIHTNDDIKLLMELRREYVAKWQDMIEKLGEGSAAECKEWKCWLSHQPGWTDRNKGRSHYRRFSFGIERIEINEAVMYREDLGISYRKPEVGMKVQSDGDLLKGVVSKILPDEKMPLVRLGEKLVRAEIICEMGKSTEKHGSLRFAHGQIALYALARHLGALEIEGQLSAEEVAHQAVEAGVYEDDTLTCEVFDATGKVSYGRFPAGVTRICRHKQDPSVVSAVKGKATEKVYSDPTSVRSGGCVNGLPDTFCMLAAGLTECARELRSEIPANAAFSLELLRDAVA